mgnify:CR=1 FL=1
MSKLSKAIIFKTDEDMYNKLNAISDAKGFNSVSAYIRVQLKKAIVNERE